MDRRDFLKSALKVGAGTAAGIALAGTGRLVGDGQRRPDVEFSEGILRRKWGAGWELEFKSDEPFEPSGKSDLVVEIAGQRYLLKEPGDIHVASDGTRILTGVGWELVDG